MRPSSSTPISAIRHPVSGRTRRSETGYTLVEVLTVAALSAAVLAGITTFYLHQQRTLLQHKIEVAASLELRAALDQMVRDLRLGGLDPTRTASAGITAFDSKSKPFDSAGVTFTLDVNSDGDTDDSDLREKRGFRVRNGALETYVDGGIDPWETLVEGIDSSATAFRYFDASGKETTVADDVRRVDVVVSLRRQVPGGGVIRRTETAGVFLRNRG